MQTIEVKTPAVPEGSYRVLIGSGILGEILGRIKEQYPNKTLFLVTDQNLVEAGHFKTLCADRDMLHYVITPPGETSKHIGTLTAILETMEKAFLGRDCLVVALGGGTVGDIAGFVAAVFKRGVSVIQIPTTTVAQADSAIGGKTGIDSSVSKNAYGAFWQPAGVYVDVATLGTMEDRQYRAGLVESVKHALIADAEYFEFIEANIDAICARDTAVLEKVAHYNCTIKATVVQADPTEKNQRRMLNYGHTVGHAVESASNFQLLHGEAIAIGIIAAGRIEIEMGLGDPSRLERITRILKKLAVPTAIPKDLTKDHIIDIIRHDKKAVGKWPKFVLIDKIGHILCQDGQWAVDVQKELVERILEKL